MGILCRNTTDVKTFACRAICVVSILARIQRPNPSRDFEIGFVWLCFLAVRRGIYFHNLLLQKTLRSFELLQIGFVFSDHCYDLEPGRYPQRIPHRRSLRTVEIGFDRVCFSPLSEVTYFCNPFSEKHLCSFKLLQIGFVFSQLVRSHKGAQEHKE